MNITREMVERAMKEMDRRLLHNQWAEACENARHNIAFEILDEAINGGEQAKGEKP